MEQNSIEEIKKKAERFESQYNKLKQEFKDYIENSRRNEETKRQELKLDSAKRLLVVADSLSRVSAAYNDISSDIIKSYSENLKKNIDVIYGQLLSASGVTSIEPIAGDKFDDKMHMALGLEYGTIYPEDSIFRVMRKGYRIENNVIRPAEVIVSKRPIEVITVMKLSLWDRILGWISPTKLRFAEVNLRIDALEQLQRGNIGRFTQDIDSLKNTITQIEAKNQKLDESERIQKEKIEKLTQDIAVQKEQIEKLTQYISSLRDIIIKLEEKAALEEQIPIQGGDVSGNAGQYQQSQSTQTEVVGMFREE